MTEVEWNGSWHPFAERFPMLSEQDLRDMAESIKETGQLNPCVMGPDGTGYDGRNRVAACRIAGVEPAWTVSEGNPYSVIIAANVHHRFLSTGQRAMAVAVELNEKGLRENGRWKRGSVPEREDIQGTLNIGQWRNVLSQAGTILDQVPDLAYEVLSGKTALDAAYQQAKDEKDRQAEEEQAERQRRKRVESLPGDLAALVDNGVRDLGDAEAEARSREIVTRVDQIRDGDGDPPPSFTGRVEAGELAWTEAATLAEQWEVDRAESIERDRERISHVIKGGWSALRRVAAKPDHPYSRELLDGFGDGTRELVENTIEEIKKEAPQW